MSESIETKVAILQTNHQTMMDKILEFQKLNKEEHEEIFTSLSEFHEKTSKSFLDLNTKLDAALDLKADKKEVKDLQVKVEELNNWKFKILGAISVLAVLFSIFKEQIINVFK